MSISRFNNRIKTNKKQKYVADNEYNLISTGKYKEIDVPGLGRFPVVEDDKPHASMDITVSDNSNSHYTYRGWDRLLNMELGECLHAMVEYIVERFWDTTNTFHFPFGEMGFTPLDWVMLTGVTIGDGVDIPYDSQKYQFEYDLDAVSTYDWGAAAFSRLYAALCIAGRKRKSLSGPFQVLEFWGYEYLGICAPEVVQPLDDQPIWPRCSRWKPKKKVVDIVRCRTSLNKLTADQVTWQPWESCRQILDSEIGVKTIMLSNARIIFSWNGVVLEAKPSHLCCSHSSTYNCWGYR
ncbi:uncharacterized protein LOC113307644 isoform X2 [Papaver somniferum]|uniref:uncharacterized protein LOC113307644 isoform X2 n=1 Tax=Papaver somniferum TaxID=3469 RepID=UPI000E704F47|nr:uncharacterized protein LOC113307644 isoform X2 [Papaver somniferum]